MAKTIASNTGGYVTPAEFLLLADARMPLDWFSDAGTPLDANDLATNAAFLAINQVAAGKIESACMRGGRYSAADLRALADAATLTNASWWLKDLQVSLAVVLAWRRRGEPDPPQTELARIVDKDLESLANGDRVFGFTETIEAGKPTYTIEDKSDWETTSQPIAHQASRMLGNRRAIVAQRPQ